MRKEIKKATAMIMICSMAFLSSPSANLNAENISTDESAQTPSEFVVTQEDIDNANVEIKNIYKDKVVFTFNGIKGANAYKFVCGDIEDTIFLENDTPVITGSLPFEAGSTIEDDIKIYPLLADENKNFELKDDAKFITISKDNVKLIPSVPKKVFVSECFPTLKELVVSWNKTAYADGVQIKILNAKGKAIKNKKVKYKKATSKSSSLNVKKIDSSRFYKLKIRSYTKFNNKTYYSKWETKYITNAIDTFVETAPSKAAFKVYWSKISGATSYTVYASTSAKGKFKKVKKVKKNKSSVYVKKLGNKAFKNGTHYFFYVVADKKVKKTTYSSPIRYSTVSTFVK